MISQKFKKSWQNFINFRSIFHHLVCYPRKMGDEWRDSCLWIYECLKFFEYFFSIVYYCGYFRYMMPIFTESCRFDIDNYVMFIVQKCMCNWVKKLYTELLSKPACRRLVCNFSSRIIGRTCSFSSRRYISSFKNFFNFWLKDIYLLPQ